MKLGEAQEEFLYLVGKLINKIYELGYKGRLGEGLRTPEQAAIYASKGKGIANSLHTAKLAIDINVFKDGVWLTEGEQFKELGEYWESLSPRCNWGGRFNDGNHFSFSWEGMKGIK